MFMQRATKILAGLIITFAALATSGLAYAGEGQGWAQTPVVSCGVLSIDPPSWIKVTFHGTVNGVPFSDTVFYGGGADPHLAVDDQFATHTTAVGPLDIVVTADSEFLGTSRTAHVTITCHEAPTTTTESSSTTTSTVAPTTTACGEARGCCLADCNGPAPTVAAEELPNTGSSSLPVGAVGFGTVGLGALALAWSRRKVAR